MCERCLFRRLERDPAGAAGSSAALSLQDRAQFVFEALLQRKSSEAKQRLRGRSAGD